MSWLRNLLNQAETERMCVRRHCTTCGSTAFLDALLEAALGDSNGDTATSDWTPAALQALACSLAGLQNIGPADRDAIRFVIMLLDEKVGERAFTDAFAPGFTASAAGRELEAMRRHHAERLARHWRQE